MIQVVQRFVCGERSPRPTSEEDAMNASEAEVDSVEAVGFPTR